MHCKFTFTITVLLLLFLSYTGYVYSDGGFISSTHNDIWEPRQLALLKYDSAKSKEQLILFTKFEGKTRNFCWIVPTPSVPQLQEAEEALFYELAEWTAIEIFYDEGGGSGCCAAPTDMAPLSTGNVEIFNEQLIGYFQTITVGADSSSHLIDSLTVWGYFNQQNVQHYQPVLDWYISKNWVFTVIRIDSSAALQQNGNGYWYGNLDPLSFTFSSDSIIYPLKISSVSTKDENMLLMFVVADHRMTFENANTEWADRINSDESRNLQNGYQFLSAYLKEGDYLTKLRHTYTAPEMTDDLVIIQASTDNEYFPSGKRGSISVEWILLLIFYLAYRKLALLKQKRKSRNTQY